MPHVAEDPSQFSDQRAVIARAGAEIAAGQGIDEATLERRLDYLDRDPDAAVPVPTLTSAAHG